MNLEGLSRINTALRILDEIDGRHGKDDPERARTAALRARLHALALLVMEADLEAMERENPSP